MTYSVVEEASSYYSELRGEAPWSEEVASDSDMEFVQVYRKMPVSFGFEVEQDDEDICRLLRITYEWHFDGSGPLETAFEPAIYPGRAIKEFIGKCRSERGCEWTWSSENREGRGCGSHIHLRPREDVDYISAQYVEAWTTAYNTLAEVVPLVLPMFCYGSARAGAFTFRREAMTWARLDSCTRRMDRARMADFLQPSYVGHPYEAVALNRKHPAKPLTLELRLAETHPSVAYELAIILNRVIRKCFERGFRSPKLLDRVDKIREIEHAASLSISRSQNLYIHLSYVRDLAFEPDRAIPGLQARYGNYLDCFRDILVNYGHPYPPMARICRLFLAGGEPWKNPTALWNVFHAPFGEFRWEQDIPAK